MNTEIKIQDNKISQRDNFLPQEKFVEIQNFCMGRSLLWQYSDNIDNKNDVEKFQFVHMFYENYQPQSQFMNVLTPILELLQPVSIYRIKSNLLTKTPTIIENKFHVDMGILSEERQKQWTTSVFYMNTNNGYTKFDNGTKVNSVANRMITFPSNMKHTGTSCTDERTRVVINCNYFGQTDSEPSNIIRH